MKKNKQNKTNPTHYTCPVSLQSSLKHLLLDLVKGRTLSYTELCNLPQEDILFKLLFYGTFIDFIYF